MEVAAEPSTGMTAALITVILMLAGVLVFVIRTYTEAKAANRAVNNVGPGEHSLWDQLANIRDDVLELVEAQRDFAKRGWQTLPDDIGTAARLTETIRVLQANDARNVEDHERIVSALAEINEAFRAHDGWERQHKYSTQPLGTPTD